MDPIQIEDKLSAISKISTGLRKIVNALEEIDAHRKLVKQLVPKSVIDVQQKINNYCIDAPKLSQLRHQVINQQLPKDAIMEVYQIIYIIKKDILKSYHNNLSLSKNDKPLIDKNAVTNFWLTKLENYIVDFAESLTTVLRMVYKAEKYKDYVEQYKDYWDSKLQYYSLAHQKEQQNFTQLLQQIQPTAALTKKEKILCSYDRYKKAQENFNFCISWLNSKDAKKDTILAQTYWMRKFTQLKAKYPLYTKEFSIENFFTLQANEPIAEDLCQKKIAAIQAIDLQIEQHDLEKIYLIAQPQSQAKAQDKKLLNKQIDLAKNHKQSLLGELKELLQDPEIAYQQFISHQLQQRACQQHIKHLIRQIWLDMVLFYGAVELDEVKELHHAIIAAPIEPDQLDEVAIIAADINTLLSV